MLSIDHIVGSRLEPGLSEQIHKLEHRGAVDFVEVPVVDLSRRRLRIDTVRGKELAIALPRDQKLYDGAVLVLDEQHAIVVRASAQRWLRLEPRSINDAIELGYHAGNLHWRVRFDGEVLLIALEGRPEDYTARLDDLITSRRIGVTVLEDFPESSDAQMLASAKSHVHFHDHGR